MLIIFSGKRIKKLVGEQELEIELMTQNGL